MNKNNAEYQIGQSTVFYYIREKLWNTLNIYCDDMYRQISDPFFIFWKAFSQLMQGDPNEAINDLISIQSKKEIQYATVQAMIYYHNQCQTVDREAIQNLKILEEDSRKLSSDKSIILAAQFYFYLDDYRRAQDILDQINNRSVHSQCLMAWIEINNEDGNGANTAFKIFEDLLKEQGNSASKHLESMMGLCQSCQITKKFTVATDTINEIIFLYPDFVPSYIEKAKICMMIGDWEQFQEISAKVHYDNPDNILAEKNTTFYTIARLGDIDAGCEQLENLISTISFKEPKNAGIQANISQLFSRISGRNSRIIEKTMKLIQKCRKINPLSADYAIELAQQYIMLEEFDKAFTYFQEAAALDESKIESLSGMIQCKIMQGVIEDAQQQLEFINEIQVSSGRTPDIAYLEGLLASKKECKSEQERLQASMKHIDEALKMHITMTKQLIPGFEFYIKLNPDFLLALSQTYLSSVGMKEMLDGKSSGNSYVNKGSKLLETILKQIPGFITGYLLKSKAKMALGDFGDAVNSINKVLELDPKNEDAYILHSLLLTKNGNFSAANNSLQQAISNNFSIRENPLFMLVKGEVEYNSGDYVSALATAEMAYELPGIKEKSVLLKKNEKSSILQFQEKDRCGIFLLLAKAMASNKKSKEAKAIMTRAISEFTGSSEEVNVLLANSEIAIKSGDIKKAISILKGVTADSPYFLQSRIILADVYLTYLKERRLYAKCYTDLIDANPSFENFRLLGDALIKIHQPEDAATAYEKALQLKPEDEDIVRSLGTALCKTHNYEKALNYYENALRQNKQRIDLLLDLAKLCIQIKHYTRAEELLQPELFTGDDFSQQNINIMKRNVEGFVQIAILNQKKMGIGNETPNDNVRKALKSSIQLQKDVIEKTKNEGGNVDSERIYLAELIVQLAKYTSKSEKNDDQALSHLDEAQRFLPDSENIISLKAEIYLRMGDKVSCENNCNMLLKLNPNSDFASLMLAELMLQKDEYTKAIEQFQKILEENPNNYGILSKLVDFYRRTFQLDKAKNYIEKAERKTTNNNDPGLCFCRGLLFKFQRQVKDALSEFNKAKKSTQYAEESLVQMIDIYLNPDQDLYYNNVEETSKNVNPDNLRACESLLREMQIRASYHRYIVMESYVLFLGKFKGGVDTGIKNLTEILKQKTDYIPAMLALSIGKFIAKKQTDAKNLLKILWKRNYQMEFGEDLERAWLLYADSFVAIQKYDNAEEILKKCLKFNQSCGKAEEYMGLIKEKEQSYVDAATHYEKAHRLTNEKSPSIGYRLAFNYLKAKRFIDCITVCKQILQYFPDYPKIEKEILCKARECLR